MIDARLSGTRDAPFTIEAAPGARVELSGARALPRLDWRPAGGDYAVRSTSPALKLGFRNFAMDDFGVRIARLRALAEHPAYPRPVLAQRPDQRETARSFSGMTIKSVETLGEQSAAGLPGKAGVMVLSVEAGSAAAKAGLKPGDVILAIDGTADAPGQDVATAASFVNTAQARRWQGSLGLTVLRNQAPTKVTLDLH